MSPWLNCNNEWRQAMTQVEDVPHLKSRAFQMLSHRLFCAKIKILHLYDVAENSALFSPILQGHVKRGNRVQIFWRRRHKTNHKYASWSQGFIKVVIQLQ